MDEQAVPSQVLDALGTAWTIHGLYPDPQSQPAFQRALATLREAASEPVLFDVRPGGFAVEGVVLEVAREGTERLSRRLFLHGVEALTVVAPPRYEEMVQFFEVLARDDHEVQESGGVEAAMLRAGIESLGVTERPPLTEAEQEESIDRDEEVVRALEQGADPELFAKALMAEAGEDPQALAELFRARYDDVYAKVADDDVTGREEVVQVFVEAFFFFGDPYQVAVLEGFLVSKEEAPNRVFLDQFAGHELAGLAPRLDPHGFSLLLDYARISTDQADQRPDELLSLLESAEDVDEARKVVAASVQRRIGDVQEAHGEMADETIEALRAQFPSSSRYLYDALMVLRGLLNVEDRPDRFERLLRIWTGKIAAAVRRREYRRAELWLRAVTDRPTYPEERRPEIHQALSQLGTPDVLEMLVAETNDGKEGEAQANLLRGLGPRAVEGLVELLGAATDASRRRILMEVLVVAGQEDPTPLLAHLHDPRWYVVRNLVVVLGRIGSSQVRVALAGQLRHEDHRVRLEVLRALAPMGALAVENLEVALRDSHPRVRQTAIGILGGMGTEHAAACLIQALARPSLDAAEKRRIVSLLAESRMVSAEEALGRLAGQRFVVSSSRRLVRDAAREALKGGLGGHGSPKAPGSGSASAAAGPPKKDDGLGGHGSPKAPGSGSASTAPGSGSASKTSGSGSASTAAGPPERDRGWGEKGAVG
jgi:HEAT repeat protein